MPGEIATRIVEHSRRQNEWLSMFERLNRDCCYLSWVVLRLQAWRRTRPGRGARAQQPSRAFENVRRQRVAENALTDQAYPISAKDFVLFSRGTFGLISS